jgi:transmembrane sensor
MASEANPTKQMVLAEAGAWLARLQGPERTAASEAAFKAWLASDVANARAFAQVTEAWELVPGAARPAAKPRRSLAPLAMAASLILAVAAGGTAYLLRDPVYETVVGGHRTVTLNDGTRVSLNTDSRMVIDYRRHERRVRLERGEALFEVAKNKARPFIVEAGEENVRALGTTFVVRRDAAKVEVTLIEGRVEVSKPKAARASASVSVLSPGQRATVRGAKVALDRPQLKAVIAWRHGELLFDDVSLLTAAAEVNRYGETHVVLGDPNLNEIRVSGVFETGAPNEFAVAIATLHGLKTETAGADIILTR